MYPESRTKKVFAIACLEKKFVFQSEISSYSLIIFSKILKFLRVKELFKSNKTGNGVYHGQVESKTKRILAIACLGKKLVFHTQFCNYFE